MKTRLSVIFALLAHAALAQVTALTPVPRIQFLDANGRPLAGGKVYTYSAGTTTPLATYTTSAGNVANANPVVLDSGGFAGIWLSPVAYKIELRSSAGVVQWTVDNVYDWAQLLKADLASTAVNKGAYMIGYKPTVGQAVARTVQAKLDEIFTIKDFGAVCDDVADDHVAIQAAIDYVVSLEGGGVLEGPAGSTCYIGTTGLVIPNSNHGISIHGPSFGSWGIRYAGSGTAVSVGVYGPTAYSYRVTLEGFKVDISGAGANAIGVLVNPALYWSLRQLQVTSTNGFSAAANHQIGIKFLGGNAADVTFGAHGVWDQVQVQGTFRQGVYMTAAQIGWGFNANSFIGGSVVYEGTAPAGQTPPYTGFWLEHGNQNVVQMIDAENWDVAWRSDDYDNTWIGIREESVNLGFRFGAPVAMVTQGGVFNKLYASSMGDGVDVSGSIIGGFQSTQLWGTTTDLGLENHINGLAFLDITLKVSGNTAIQWQGEGGSSGVFWLDQATHTDSVGSLYNSGAGPVLQCGSAMNARNCVLNSTGGNVRIQNGGADIVTVDSSEITVTRGIASVGNVGHSFVNAGGGGSTGLYWKTGPGAITNSFMIDNGSQLITTVGTAGSARDYVINLVNTGAQIKYQVNGVDFMRITGTSIAFDKPASMAPVSFASLGAANAGKIVWCPDCTIATPCTGAGVTGAWAFANGIQWKCPF